MSLSKKNRTIAIAGVLILGVYLLMRKKSQTDPWAPKPIFGVQYKVKKNIFVPSKYWPPNVRFFAQPVLFNKGETITGTTVVGGVRAKKVWWQKTISVVIPLSNLEGL